MQLVFSNDFAEIWKDETSGQAALYATRSFKAGDFICEFGASAILHKPSYLTVQKDIDEHICLHPQYLQYINHGCAPNVFFDISRGILMCIQPVMAGNELTYFYPSTEWHMAEPFQCQCGNDQCLQYIRGAAFLSGEVLKKYRLSDFIQLQLKNKNH